MSNLMQLAKIRIQNYKSLKNVEIEPKNFSVLIGRNSSGKSNFADALEFLAIAYSDGIEHAIARKGGYENIAFRKERRSRSALEFAIELRAEMSDSEVYPPSMLNRNSDRVSTWIFRHKFEIKATGEGIRSDFRVVSESLDIIKDAKNREIDDIPYEWLNFQRSEDGKINLKGDLDSPMVGAVLFDPKYWMNVFPNELSLAGTELLFTLPFFRTRVVGRFTSWLTKLAIFQVSPDISRHPGVPTPNPRLSSRGENLPAVVDWLQSKRPKDWKLVMRGMREIVPELKDVTVNYLHTRTLGLYFHEEGIGRPWTAEEVSDGTIRALAMLVACFDPRNTVLLIEEPENSLHPWIIREIMKNLRSLSSEKMVMVTTHSPIVLDMLSPSEVWVIFKRDGETHLSPLVGFDSDLMTDWESGKIRLFDYLESGYVSEAVPSGAI